MLKSVLRNMNASRQIFIKMHKGKNFRQLELVSRLTNPNKKILLLGTPTHGNLGDEAISIAELDFLKKRYAKVDLIEITNEDVPTLIDVIKNNLASVEAVFIHGVGNVGSIYIYAEKMRRLIIKNIVGVPLISFPQSMISDNTWFGKMVMRTSSKVYKANSHLQLIAREPGSLDLMKKTFKNSLMMVPDIVLSLDFRNWNFQRHGILMLMRNDIEESLSEEGHKVLKKAVESVSNDVIFSDTFINSLEEFSEYKRLELVVSKLKQVAEASVVITDRLHGMIFAYITGTPCLIIKNSNHKITDTYFEFLSEANYIELLDFSNCDAQIKRMAAIPRNSYKSSNKVDFSNFESLLERVIQNNE